MRLIDGDKLAEHLDKLAADYDGGMTGTAAFMAAFAARLARAAPAVEDEIIERATLEIAAYLFDRAGQIAASSPGWIALSDVARAVATGEAQASAARGELDDLVAKVRRMRKRTS